VAELAGDQPQAEARWRELAAGRFPALAVVAARQPAVR
jgi:hypothetical protein